MLVDTSVWINHFRRPNMDLEHLLDEGRVMTHPFVIGELACGSLRRRAEVLRLLEALPAAPVATHGEVNPAAPVATHGEVIIFIEREHLHGTGLGWVDIQLLASARLSRQSLWSADRRLREAALRLGLANAE